MKKRYSMFMIFMAVFFSLKSQPIIPLPANLPQGHPRLLTTDTYKPVLEKQIADEPWAREVLDGIINRIDPFVGKTQTQPDWLLSRLMMYWKSRATNVYINGGVYVRADGEAPVPTVRFGSTRGIGTPIKRPKLEDVIPYMDDTKGVYFQNTDKDGSPLEWIDQASVSGANIESVNNEILRLGRDGAFVYWLTNDDTYGKFAYDVFDTYMSGMYYRNEPIDLGNGHAQTLVGLSTFEVIQEHILSDLAVYYDFLYPYIQTKHEDKIEVYEASFKKWIDITIKNGVPHNNWNLHQGKLILKVAMVLADNSNYIDGKGREYYIDCILNKSSARQWSLLKFMEFGYDSETGIWNECPGYAQGVTKDLTNFIRDFDNTFNHNLLSYTPVLRYAVNALPQYLFPNNMIAAFGDTYYGGVNTEAMSDMIVLAQKYNNREDEVLFTQMYKLFEPKANDQKETPKHLAPQVSSFFTGQPLRLDSQIEKGNLSDYLTPTFYAPNVSWFVQRNGFESKEHGLMISQVGSFGNHAHSNGISMEFYGKGFVLGPESGIGSSYFEKPYLEYYSQFPAHNTVMVDGISKYPEMLSNHPFDLKACYPSPGLKSGYSSEITFSNVAFVEPESRSDQTRLLSIVRTSETSGYYIDIFRSKKQRGGDKFHDYFYHNLGQEMHIADVNGEPLPLQSNDEMAFAGGHLFALDYMWDKRSCKTDKDYQAVWKMTMPDGNHVYMNLWMKGYPEREVFSIKAPPCKAFRGDHGIPYQVDKEPFLTFAARQHGQAWTRPFVSVFEPTTEREGKSIQSIESFELDHASPDFVGLIIRNKSGRVDYVFSSVQPETIQYNKFTVKATYALISETSNGFSLFMGAGTMLSANEIIIEASECGSAVFEMKKDRLFFNSEIPVRLLLPDTYSRGKVVLDAGSLRVEGKRVKVGSQKKVEFQLPSISYQQISIKSEK
jgi:hypothetical protein